MAQLRQHEQTLSMAWPWQAEDERELPPSERSSGATRLNIYSPLLGPASGKSARAVSYIRARLPQDSPYQSEVEAIVACYWHYAPPVGLDPFLAAAQAILETAALRAGWLRRAPCNPGGLGVHDEGGLAFASWELGVQAHLGQLLAFALHDEQASATQRAMMQQNPRHGRIRSWHRGAAPLVAGLSKRWMNDPTYAQRLVELALNLL